MNDDLDLKDFRGLGRLFPLPDVVLLPDAVLPLHIFEPRYRRLTEDALATDRLITMVRIRPGVDWRDPQEPEVETIGCLGRILNHQRLPDGRFYLLLHGRKRARIIRERPARTLYRQAELELLDDFECHPIRSDHADELVAVLHAHCGLAARLDPDFQRFLDSAPPLGTLTNLLAQSLNLPASLKQLLLEERDPSRRALTLIRYLGRPESQRPRPYPPPFCPN